MSTNINSKVNGLVIDSFSYNNRPIIMMKGNEYISDFHLHCTSSVDLILYTDYLKSLVNNKLNFSTTSDFKFKHSTVTDNSGVTDVEKFKELLLKQTLKNVPIEDKTEAKNLLKDRYVYLFDFEHPFNNERYYVLLDRYFRDFLIIPNLLFLNVKGLSLDKSRMIKTISVASSNSDRNFLGGSRNTALSTTATSNRYDVDNGLKLGNSITDISDTFSLQDISVGLVYLNNRFYNGEKFISCKFKDGKDNSYHSINKDYEAYICINFGKLSNYLKPTTDLQTYYKSLNIKTIIPQPIGNEKHYIEPVRNYLDDGIEPSIDINKQEFCVMLKVL